MASIDQNEENFNTARECSITRCNHHVYPEIKILGSSPKNSSDEFTPASFRCDTPLADTYADSTSLEFVDAREWSGDGEAPTPIRDDVASIRTPLLYNNSLPRRDAFWHLHKQHRSSTPTIIGYEAPNLPDDVSNIEDDVTRQSIAQILKKSLRRFSARQWGALLGVCYVNFASNASISILTSFFSNEALDHGANQLEIGLIFGCYAIVNSICCPLFGCFVPMCGAKNLLLAGLLLSSVCSVLFSQLFRLTSTVLFVAGCFLCRAIQALGCAAYFTGSSVIIAREWRDNITFAMGLSEIFTGIGMICGPLLGGLVYEKGGFQLPFICIALVMLLGLVINFYAISKSSDKASTANFWTLIKIPNVAVTCILMSVMWAAMDFNMPSLSLHMKVIEATPVQVGTMFLIMAAAYTVFAPFIGMFAKNKCMERMVMICGGLLVATSFILVGPSPVLAQLGVTEVSFPLVGVSMGILGAGLSMALVPTFSDLTASAVCGGMADDLATAGLVSGLFNGAVFFGEFIGPTVGGALMQQFDDYKVVSSIFAAFVFLVVILTAIFYIMDWRKDKSKRKKEQNRPCLDTVQTLYGTMDD